MWIQKVYFFQSDFGRKLLYKDNSNKKLCHMNFSDGLAKHRKISEYGWNIFNSKIFRVFSQ